MKNIGLKLQLIVSGAFILAILVFALFHINIQPTPSLPALAEKSEATADSRQYRLDINTADEKDLILLPGIGESLAKQIIAYRDEYGPFESISDLEQVKGIKQATLNEISDYITIGG